MEKKVRQFNAKEFLLWFPVIGYILNCIAVFPLQVAAFVLIKPFSLWLYRKISYFFSLMMYWHSTSLVLWWSNTNLEIFMDPKHLPNSMGNEHSIFLLNHRYEAETFMTMSVWNFFRSSGNLRWFSKKDLQYLPIAGWLWNLQEHIFLERNFDKDKEIVEKALPSLMKHSDAITITLFPEGTRFTAEKHKASMIVAKEKGFPELKYHLLPRTKGFVTCINTLKNGSNFGLPVVIYDALFVMESQHGEGTSFSILDLLKGHGPKVKLLLRRYPVENIPEDETECAQWLHWVYQEKDGFMDNCLKTGKFVENNDKTEVYDDLKGFEFIKVPKPISVLVFIGCWDMICALGMLGKIVYVLKSGNIFQLLALFVVIMLGNIVYSILTGSTKIETGSSYGKINNNVHK